MRFLIIIICLLSERFMTHHFQNLRQSWLPHYINFIKKNAPKKLFGTSDLNLYLICISILIVLCGIVATLSFLGPLFILNTLFEFIVFYLCLGEHNLFFMNTHQKNIFSPKEYIMAINSDIFAIIVWFFILGPIGVLLYRVTTYFFKLQSFNTHIASFQYALDWLPIRITALLFLMVGQFQPGFNEYLKSFFNPPEQNSQFLFSITEHAITTKSLDKVQTSKLEGLYTHSCLLLIFILAVYMIGKLL